jgi:hypothetical protein
MSRSASDLAMWFARDLLLDLSTAEVSQGTARYLPEYHGSGNVRYFLLLLKDTAMYPIGMDTYMEYMNVSQVCRFPIERVSI